MTQRIINNTIEKTNHYKRFLDISKNNQTGLIDRYNEYINIMEFYINKLINNGIFNKFRNPLIFPNLEIILAIFIDKQFYKYKNTVNQIVDVGGINKYIEFIENDNIIILGFDDFEEFYFTTLLQLIRGELNFDETVHEESPVSLEDEETLEDFINLTFNIQNDKKLVLKL